VFVPPLERPLTHAFTPHVTLSDDVDQGRLAGALEALRGYVVEVRVDRVHLLQEQRHGDAHRRWVPVADVPFGPRSIVGRGGLELELTTSRLLDPEAAAFETGHWPADEPSPPAAEAPPGCEPLVVVARRRDEVVGVVRGAAGPDRVDITGLLVGPAHRGEGIARHLLAAFHHAADAHR
jgi:ribosomal protein S18 acetylase RimI-like enzyme